jgi:hypothetical protein
MADEKADPTNDQACLKNFFQTARRVERSTHGANGLGIHGARRLQRHGRGDDDQHTVAG